MFHNKRFIIIGGIFTAIILALLVTTSALGSTPDLGTGNSDSAGWHAA